MSERPATSDAPETRVAIMEATYRALCEHGYANLTTQRIADELGKSTALLHYYFESKEALLVAFLEYLLTRLDTRVTEEVATPPERLAVLVDTLLPGPDAASDIGIALLEMKAQSPYTAAFRTQLRANDERIEALIESIIADGLETGDFAAVDPSLVAERLLILIEGARTRSVVLDSTEPRRVGRATIEAYLASLRGGGDAG